MGKSLEQALVGTIVYFRFSQGRFLQRRRAFEIRGSAGASPASPSQVRMRLPCRCW